MRFRLSPNLALTAGTIVACVLAFEVYLRQDDRRPEPAWASIEVAGDTFPLLDDPKKLARLDDSVVFLGDSFTEGAACGPKGNFPAAFAKLAQGADRDLVTINLAREGANTFAYLARGRALAAAGARPRGVITTLFINDIERDCSLCPFLPELEAEGGFTAAELAELAAFCAQCAGRHDDIAAHYSAPRRVHRWLYEQSWLYRLSRDASYQVLPALGIRAGWGMGYPEQWQDQGGLSYRLLEWSMAMLAETLDEAEAPHLVTLYPPARQITADNPYAHIYARAAADLEARTGHPVLSGYAAFLDHPQASRDMPFSLTDAHPSCAMHRLYGEWVWREWQARFLPPDQGEPDAKPPP
jgi:hypothetical protein